MKLFHAIANFLSGFWTDDLEPWLKALGNEVKHDIVTDIMPILADTADELGVDILAPGTLSEKWAKATTIIAASAAKIEQSTVNISVHDLAIAGAGLLAIASAKAKGAALTAGTATTTAAPST